MTLPDGYSDVPDGKIAAVVTLLEMTAAPAAMPEPPDAGCELRHMPTPDLAWYRDLFSRVGGDWLWFSRLALSDEALAAIIHDPHVEVHAVWIDGRAEGLLELDFATDGQCEISFLGLARPLVGRGVGQWLMHRALAMAWSRPIQRVRLKTCTNDHARALGYYLRSGFRAYGRQIEVADDPRISGVMPRTAAPNVPIIPVATSSDATGADRG